MKKTLGIILISAVTSVLSVFIYSQFSINNTQQENQISGNNSIDRNSNFQNVSLPTIDVDLKSAAKSSVDAVVHIKKYPTPPFEQQKEQIRQAIWRVHNQEIESGFYDYLDQLRKKYRLEYKPRVMEMFLEKMKQNPKTSNERKSRSKDLKNRFSTGELSQVIAELSFTTIPVKEVVELLNLFPSHRRPRFRTIDDVRAFVGERVVQQHLLER